MNKAVTLLTTTMILLLSIIAAKGQEIHGRITLADAVAIAEEMLPGEVFKAELRKSHYKVDIRTMEGKVEALYIDIMTGKALEKKEISLNEAIEIATRMVPGKVVKVEFERNAYQVKIMTEQEEVKVYVDASTGEVLKVKTK